MDKLFTESQMRVLQAALDRIIPADDYPGAWESGGGDYILRQMESDSKSLLPLYRLGLDAIDAEAVTAYGQHFADLYPARQDALISNLERGTTGTHWVISAPGFINTLISHTVEGYYADAGQGGNHDEKSWKMVGFNQAGRP